MGQGNVVFKIGVNPNQDAYLSAVNAACDGRSDKRVFAYGGGIRGGKTFVTLFILCILAKRYAGSRWHVIRASLPVLMGTTIPSFLKLMPSGCKMNYQPGNVHCEFPNGSKIYFKSENINQDSNLDAFLGLETNGIFLEQSEELSLKMWEMAQQRTGSWYIPNMPPAFLFLTFNPTDTWSREVFYDAYHAGTLPDRYHYQNALPEDSPFITEDQWEAWRGLDPITYAMMIQGNWDARKNNNSYYFSFSRFEHLRELDFNHVLPIHLSFDQNVLPYITMTCWQVHVSNGHQTLYCFDEVTLEPPKSTSQHLAEQFKAAHPNARQVYLYGDASGNKRDTRANMSDYDIIKNVLRYCTNNTSDRTFKKNPGLLQRREFLAALMAGKIPGASVLIHPKCKKLISDLLEITTDANGDKFTKKAKGEKGETYELYGHASDTLDYICTKVFERQFKVFVNNRFRIVAAA